MIEESEWIYWASLRGITKYRIIKAMPKTIRVRNPNGPVPMNIKRTTNVCFTLDEAIEEVISIHQRRRQRTKAMYDEEVVWDYDVETWKAATRKELG